MDNVFSLLLGWLFGLLSPIIHDRLRSGRAKKELKEGIFNELKELKSRMAANVFQISVRNAPFDRELLNWILKHAEEFKGTVSSQLLETLKNLSKLDDQELATGWQQLQAQFAGTALNLKPFRVPFIDSSMGSLSSLGSVDQEKIIAICARINLVNDDIDLLHWFYEKTFTPGLTDENYEIIKNNQKSLYPKVSCYLRDIVNMISRLISGSGQTPAVAKGEDQTQ